MFDFPLAFEPAFAGVPGAYLPREKPAPCDTHVMKFNTGPLQPQRSSAGRIARWEALEVLPPGQSPSDKNQVSCRDAQVAVSALRKPLTSSHEYLTYEAVKLTSTLYPILDQYLLHLVSGANAEDFIFSPGEEMESICHGDRGRITGMTRADFSALVAGKDSSSGVTGTVFQWASSLWNWLTGGGDSDALNRPYFAHFIDLVQSGEGGLSILDGGLRFQSALTRLELYWNIASSYLTKEDRPRAFCALGHALHLIQDLHVPAHVHNDIHGPTIILGKLDSLEVWCGNPDYQDIRRSPDEPNIRIWNSKPLAPPVPDSSWTYEDIESRLRAFALKIAFRSQCFRSVDVEGTADTQKTTGKLTDAECFHQAGVLVPWAIVDSAQFLANFLDYHKRLYGINLTA